MYVKHKCLVKKKKKRWYKCAQKNIRLSWVHYIARLAVDRYRYTWAYTHVQTHDHRQGYVTNLKDMGPDFS